MKALILIGGMGTRLRPLTCETPKPMLPIANRPFLEYQFELLKKHGIRDIVLCVAYLHREFQRYFGTGRKWGVKLSYVHETTPLGTGGAIKNAQKLIGESRVLIFNGDILTTIDLTDMIRFHESKKALVSIALSRVKDPTMYGLVETERNGKIRRFLEKPSPDEVTCNTINSGIYIFEPRALNDIPAGVNYSVERGLFPALLGRRQPLYGYAYGEYWLDIGTLEKYLQAHHDVMEGNVNFSPRPGGKPSRTGRNVVTDGKLVCGSNVRIGEGVRFQGNVCLGNGVTIGCGSSITDSVILDNTVVNDGVRIEGALIGKNCVIEENVAIRRGAALGNRTSVRKYSRI